MADIQSVTAEIRRGKKNKRQDENVMVCPIPYGDHDYFKEFQTRAAAAGRPS